MFILLSYFGTYTLVIYIVVRFIWQIVKRKKYSFWKDKWIVVCAIVTFICSFLAISL